MKRLNVHVTAVVAIIFCLMVFSAGNSWALVLDVGDGGYTSIQTAINDANVGDYVVVHAGTYLENIKMKDGVGLFGDGISRPTISGTVTLANDSILSGFHIMSSGNTYGVIGDSLTNVVINNNILGPVTENNAWASAFGIYLNNMADVSVTTNLLYDVSESLWGSAYGIYNNNSSNALLEYNTIAYISETAWSNAYGIFNQNSGVVSTIENNIIAYVSQNAWGAAYGIYDDGSSAVNHNDVWSVANAAHNVAGTANGMFNPLFANAAARDFHLQDNSAALTWAVDGGEIGFYGGEVLSVPSSTEPISEPATMLLLIPALLSLISFKKKRKC